MADKKGYYEQTDAQFKIRLPHELKEKIRASAEKYNRTMTADIVARLEQSFGDDVPNEAQQKKPHPNHRHFRRIGGYFCRNSVFKGDGGEKRGINFWFICWSGNPNLAKSP